MITRLNFSTFMCKARQCEQACRQTRKLTVFQSVGHEYDLQEKRDCQATETDIPSGLL